VHAGSFSILRNAPHKSKLCVLDRLNISKGFEMPFVRKMERHRYQTPDLIVAHCHLKSNTLTARSHGYKSG
jgi:hypothetical protein